MNKTELLEQKLYKLVGLLKESKLILSHEPDVECAKHITSGNLEETVGKSMKIRNLRRE